MTPTPLKKYAVVDFTDHFYVARTGMMADENEPNSYCKVQCLSDCNWNTEKRFVETKPVVEKLKGIRGMTEELGTHALLSNLIEELEKK